MGKNFCLKIVLFYHLNLLLIYNLSLKQWLCFIKWIQGALGNPRGLHLLTCPFHFLCNSCADTIPKLRWFHLHKLLKINIWEQKRGNSENTPVTPQRTMYCIFSCCLQGPHFNPGVRGSWGSLGGRVVWVSAWGNTVIQTVSFVNFRLISWFWNVKGKYYNALNTDNYKHRKVRIKTDSILINVRST